MDCLRLGAERPMLAYMSYKLRNRSIGSRTILIHVKCLGAASQNPACLTHAVPFRRLCSRRGLPSSSATTRTCPRSRRSRASAPTSRASCTRGTACRRRSLRCRGHWGAPRLIVRRRHQQRPRCSRVRCVFSPGPRPRWPHCKLQLTLLVTCFRFFSRS